MRHKLWLHVLLCAALAVVLTGCGLTSLRTTDGSQTPRSSPPPQPTAFGLDRAGPLPEYRIRLTLDAPNRQLMGDEYVRIPNRIGTDLNEVVFRLYPNLPQYGGSMAVDGVWVDGQPVTPRLRADRTSLWVPLPQPLPPQASTAVSLTLPSNPLQQRCVLFGLSRDLEPARCLSCACRPRWRRVARGCGSFQGDAVFADTASTRDLTATIAVAATRS
jgi:hypothetical protein